MSFPRTATLVLTTIAFASCASLRASSFPSDPPPAVAPAHTAPSTAVHAQQDSPLVPVSSSPVRGPRDALVTVVEFGDFQCPFCTRVEPTLQRLRDRFGTDVRFVWKNAPLRGHPDAMPAAEAAMEVQHQRGDEAFWRFHDALLENPAALRREALEQLAVDCGADLDRLHTALDQHLHADAIAVDLALYTQLGARGTPFFLVNGTPVSGAKPFEHFERVVAQALEHARTITPPERAYAEMTASPLPAPAPPPRPIVRHTVPDGVGPAPSRGPAGARVVVQMFADYQCPFCARVGPAVEALLAAHPDDVRLVWRDYPLSFHAHARLAAEAAREAFAQGGDAGYWRYHDLLMANQRALARADLERYAHEAGLDLARFRTALDHHTHGAVIDADLAAADATGVDMGTPAFFVNGRLIEGAAPLEEFETVVRSELAPPPAR